MNTKPSATIENTHRRESYVAYDPLPGFAHQRDCEAVSKLFTSVAERAVLKGVVAPEVDCLVSCCANTLTIQGPLGPTRR
jgi:hypothetical protein